MTVAKIETLEQNPIGRQLYPSLGFQEVARQIHYAMPLVPRNTGRKARPSRQSDLETLDFSSATQLADSWSERCDP